MRSQYLGLLAIAVISLVSEIGIASPVEISIPLVSDTVEKGQEFTVNISIDPVNNPITAAQFNLLFNSTFLEIKNITEGNLFKQDGADTVFNSGILNNSDGTLVNVWGLIITPGANITTKGDIAALTMHSKDAGTSLLNLTNVIVSDPNSQALQVKITNGSIDSVDSTPTPTPEQTTGSGGSGGGGGGGGAGGTSGENYTNIELKEKYDLYIYKDVTTSYCFRKVGNPIVCINITGNVNAGEINTAVEVLRNTSSLVNTPPEGVIYKNINIWVGTSGFATPQNIKEAVILFRVNKSWIYENSIDPASITLLRYSDGWDTLPTRGIGENITDIYYEAKTNSFTHFAVTGKKSGNQNYSLIYPITSSSYPLREQKNTIKSGESEGTSGLTILLLIGLLIGSAATAVLVLKIRKLR